MWRRGVVALAGALLIAFGVWCVTLTVSVSALRRDVEMRVGWLSAMQEAQTGDSRSFLAQAEEMRTQAAFDAATRVVLERAARGSSIDPGDLNALIVAVRKETSEISRQLGAKWTSINVLAAIS